MTATTAPTAGHRRVALVALVVGLVVLVVAAFALGQSSVRGRTADAAVLGVQFEAARGRGNGAAAAPPPKTFEVTGSVAGLAPGVDVALPVTVRNDHSQPIEIRGVTAIATSSDQEGCGPDLLDVAPWTGTRRMDGRSTAALELVATLSPDAPDACKGVTFTLAYGGAAVQLQGPGRP